MATNDKPEDQQTPATPTETSEKVAVKFYRSRLSGLSVIVGPATAENPEPEYVRFNAYHEKFEGDPIKVGYLATDNQTAQDKLSSDPNVEEISKDEFKKYTDTSSAKVIPAPR